MRRKLYLVFLANAKFIAKLFPIPLSSGYEDPSICGLEALVRSFA